MLELKGDIALITSEKAKFYCLRMFDSLNDSDSQMLNHIVSVFLVVIFFVFE